MGFYELNKPVRSKRKNTRNLEKYVISRELYIVEWDWMNKFPKYHTSGKTEISEWDYYLRYPQCSKLPDVFMTYEVNGGKVHLTDYSQQSHFNLDETDIKIEEVPF